MTPSVDRQFAVEVHPAGWRFPTGNSWVAGWISPGTGRTITDVRARIHHRVILGLAGLPHPAFPANSSRPPGSSGPGFSFLLTPQAGATHLRLEARDQTGQWTEFFRTEITAASDAPAPPAPADLATAIPPLATSLLKRQRQSPEVSWLALADELMAAFVTEPLAAHPNAPFAGALEEPREFGRQRYGRVSVTGWIAHPHSKITRLSTVIDPLPATVIPHGLPRPDDTGTFHAQGGQANSSFAGEIAMPANLAQPVLLKIFADLENGEKHLVFARRFIPRLHGATGEMPPLVSGRDYTCAVWALHRAAGRYAVPRHGVIRSAHAAWTRYRSAPAYRAKTKRFAALKKMLPWNKSGPTRQNPGEPAIAPGKKPSMPHLTDISPTDDMLVPDNPQYFQLGHEALTLVQTAVAQAGCTQVNAILDLPGGHGRVARWFRTAYPQARLTVCDVQKAGVDFCIEQLEATGVVAQSDGSHWAALPGPYDIIWCGSLLTHFDRDQWIDHLRRFAERLSPHGVLVFTTHGFEVLDRLQNGEKDYGLPLPEIGRLCAGAVANGFGYVDYPDTPGYGISVSQPDWILELLAKETALHAIDFRIAAWDQHQDVVVCTHRAPDRRR